LIIIRINKDDEMEILIIVLIIVFVIEIFEKRLPVEILGIYLIGIVIAYMMEIDNPYRWPIVLYQFVKSEMGK